MCISLRFKYIRLRFKLTSCLYQLSPFSPEDFVALEGEDVLAGPVEDGGSEKPEDEDEHPHGCHTRLLSQ